MKNNYKPIIGIATLLGILLLLLPACSSEDDNLLGTGTFEAEEVLVSSEANGKVIRWDLHEGDTVTRGKVIGVIDTTQLHLQKEMLLRSDNAVNRAHQSVDTQTAALRTRLRDLESQRARIEKLLSGGAATRKDLDDINTGIRMTQDQLAAATSRLNSGNSRISAQSSAIDVQVAQVEDMIKRSIVTSPISGTIISNFVKEGELTAQGAPLFRVADLSRMTLRAYLTGDALTRVKLGERVTVRVDGSGKESTKEYEGEITWISAESEFTPKTVQTKDERTNLVYAVKVIVPNDGYIRIGMYGEVVPGANTPKK